MVFQRRLKLWGALGLSLGLTGPTLAMAGNAQGVVATAGKAVPLVFLLGFGGVAVVAHGFVRLTQRYNHAGSAYALVGATLGPRAGFVAGFALLGTYFFFTVSTSVIFAVFLNALLGSLGVGTSAAFGIAAAVCLSVSGFLNTRDTTTVSRSLLIIEGIGIAAMLVLVVAILGQGGASSTGLDLRTFTPAGAGLGAVMAAVVLAFLSWAGFEACAALGEETDHPRRNIPRALLGSVLITGGLFVVVMFAQTVGFGTDARGLATFQSSGNTLGDLGEVYIAHWFSLLILVTAILSAFASNLSSVLTCARLAMALSRDGFGPPQLAVVDPRHRTPRNAVIAAAATAVAIVVISWLARWPNMGTGSPAIDAYFFYAVVGTTCLLFVYLLVEVAVVAAWRAGRIQIRRGELVLPTVGGLFIVGVISYTIKDATGVSPAYVGLGWVVAGAAVTVIAKALTERIGVSLGRELDETSPTPEVTDVRQGD